MRGKFTVKKAKNEHFSNTFCEETSFQALRDDKDTKAMMKEKILKVSSDLAIKSLQPQGYRGMSRGRYRSLNQGR